MVNVRYGGQTEIKHIQVTSWLWYRIAKFPVVSVSGCRRRMKLLRIRTAGHPVARGQVTPKSGVRLFGYVLDADGLKLQLRSSWERN